MDYISISTIIAQVPAAESRLFQDPVYSALTTTLMNSAEYEGGFLSVPTLSVDLTYVCTEKNII